MRICSIIILVFVWFIKFIGFYSVSIFSSSFSSSSSVGVSSFLMIGIGFPFSVRNFHRWYMCLILTIRAFLIFSGIPFVFSRHILIICSSSSRFGDISIVCFFHVPAIYSSDGFFMISIMPSGWNIMLAYVSLSIGHRSRSQIP